MEQIQQLLEILKSTPEMAIWGLAIWCLYILAKLGSIVYAIKVVFQLAINKWHDYKVQKLAVETKKLEVEEKDLLMKLSEKDIRLREQAHEHSQRRLQNDRDLADILKLSKLFKNAKISDIEMDEFRRLIEVMKSSTYIHQSDIKKAIKTLENAK